MNKLFQDMSYLYYMSSTEKPWSEATYFLLLKSIKPLSSLPEHEQTQGKVLSELGGNNIGVFDQY